MAERRRVFQHLIDRLQKRRGDIVDRYRGPIDEEEETEHALYPLETPRERPAREE